MSKREKKQVYKMSQVMFDMDAAFRSMVKAKKQLDAMNKRLHEMQRVKP